MATETNSVQGIVESWERLIELQWNAFKAIENLAAEELTRGDKAAAGEYEKIAQVIADRAHAIEDAPPAVAVCSDADANYLMEVLERAAAPTSADREPWIQTMAAASLALLKCWLAAQRVRVIPTSAMPTLPVAA